MFIEFSDDYLLRTDNILAIALNNETEGEVFPGIFIVSTMDTRKLISKDTMEAILENIRNEMSMYHDMSIEDALRVARDYVAIAVETSTCKCTTFVGRYRKKYH